IDDCVAMNDALDAPLDEADPIEQSYNLQICSAGIERELVRDFHFEMFIGSDIMVKLPKADESGTKLRKGVLKAYDKGVLTVAFEDGTEKTYDKKEYTQVKLDDFGGFND
ncbi:MAG: ribosome maturation factor RimP, partial [Clostridia bacterium]|nr:ribosome maturation factor RimP [Clostridia bacterium]